MAEKSTLTPQIEKILSELDGSSDSFLKLADKISQFGCDNSFLTELFKGLKEKFPPVQYKNRVGYTKVLLELGNAQGKISPQAARSAFQLVKSISNKLALTYISWAQLELTQKNDTKALTLLKNARAKNAEPTWLLEKAFANMIAGKTDLLDTVNDPWENVNTSLISTSSSENSFLSAQTTIIPAAASVNTSVSSVKDPESPHGGTMPLSSDTSWWTERSKYREKWNLGKPVRFKPSNSSAKKHDQSTTESVEIKPLPTTPFSTRNKIGELSTDISMSEFKPLDLSGTSFNSLKFSQMAEFEESKVDTSSQKGSCIKPLITNENDDSFAGNKKDTDEDKRRPKCQSPKIVSCNGMLPPSTSSNSDLSHNQSSSAAPKDTDGDKRGPKCRSPKIVSFNGMLPPSISSNSDMSHNPSSSAAPIKFRPNSNNLVASDTRNTKPDLSRLDSGSYDNENISPESNEFTWGDKHRTNGDSGFQDHESPFKAPNQLPLRSIKKTSKSSTQELPFTHKDCKAPLRNDVLKEKHIIHPSTPRGPETIIQNIQSVTATNKRGKLLRIKQQHYKVISVVGRGGSSKVYEVESENQERFAVKRVQLDDVDDAIMQSYINEIQFLLKLKGNPYIIELYDWEVYDETLYMLMERGDMDLAKYFKTHRDCGEDALRTYWKQMLYAVDAIHRAGIIHLDLKPANFLFVNKNIKLIDFGIANNVQVNRTSVTRECQIGTLNYMAPEAMTDLSFERIGQDGKPKLRLRCATDVWSLGCILFYMVYGKTPYQHITNQTLKIEAIKSGRPIEFRCIENENLLDSIKGCLCHNPRSRYTIEQLLSHPFLTKRKRPIDDIQHNVPADEVEPLAFSNKNNLFATQFAEAAINSPKVINRVRQSLFKNSSQMKDQGYQTLKGKLVF